MIGARSERLPIGRAGAALLAGTLLVFAGLSRSALMERWEFWAYDQLCHLLRAARGSPRLAGWVRPVRPSRELVVIALDDRTVNTLSERLPMSRARFATFLLKMKKAGADLTALDFFFHGSSPDPQTDRALADAIRENGRVVVAMRVLTGGDKAILAENYEPFKLILLDQTPAMSAPSVDSLARSALLFVPTAERVRPGLALSAVARHWKLRADELAPQADGGRLVFSHAPEDGRATSVVVPLQDSISGESDAMLLDLATDEFPFRVVSLCDLDAALAADPELVRGKIVLMGSDSLWDHDYVHVPLSARGAAPLPGVYMQATAIHHLLTGSAPERASRELDLAVLVALGLAGAFLFTRFSEHGAALAFALLAVGHAGAAAALFLRAGLWVATCAPVGLLAALLGESIWLRLAAAQRDRARCELLLSSYFSPAAAAGLATADDPAMAERLLAVKEMLAPPGYEIVSRLGQGGMSVVFRAVHRPLARTVALKFIAPRMHQDAAARARFLREARLAGSILHANLVTVFDSGECHGIPYLAMELVEGENLRTLIERRGGLPAGEAAGVLAAALAGLAHVHDRGIVHRDIKSENILLALSGAIKIADFGIAKSTSGDAFQTLDDIILGTPAYMPPEVIRGEPPTARSDLYSLGIVLYEMLTGGVPFVGDSAARILNRHVHEALPDPAEAGRDVPRGLAALLRRLAAKDPAERPATAADALVELQRLQIAEVPAAISSASPSGKHATVRTSRKTAAPTAPVPRITG